MKVTRSAPEGAKMAEIEPWLEELGLGQHADVFEENEIDTDLGRDVGWGMGYYCCTRRQEA